MVFPETDSPVQTLTNVKHLPVTNSHSAQIPLVVLLVNVKTDFPVTDLSATILTSVKLTHAILMHLVIMSKVFFLSFIYSFFN